MFEILDKARRLELKYRLLDPTSMGEDAEYTSYGPYAICSMLQDEHGKLIAESDWPVLATKLPESNSAPTVPLNQVPTSTDKAIQCYKCHQWGHKANNPKCSLFNQQKSNDTPSVPQGQGKKPSHTRPKNPWKYIEPKDLAQPCIIYGRSWYFCTKCKCRAMGKLGFYQLSHTDETHDLNWRPEGNLTPISDPDPTPSAPIRPPLQRAVLEDDELVFTGVNCAMVLPALTNAIERENDLKVSLRTP